MRPLHLAFATIFLPAALSAQVATRTTVTTINTGPAADFSGATYTYDNTFLLRPNYSGTFTNNFDIAAGARNITTLGINGVTTSPGTVPDFSSTYLFGVTGTGVANASYTLSYNGGALGFITPTTVGSRYALSFGGGGTNGVDVGGIFNSSVRVLGNWADPSRHTSATYSSGYTVLNNFIYDGTYTNFDVTTSNFPGGSPSIGFTLLGGTIGAVPEPGTWAMFILGFGAAGTALRRTRRTPATPLFA